MTIEIMVRGKKQPLTDDEFGKRLHQMGKALDKKLATKEYVDEQIAKLRREVTKRQ